MRSMKAMLMFMAVMVVIGFLVGFSRFAEHIMKPLAYIAIVLGLVITVIEWYRGRRKHGSSTAPTGRTSN